MSVNFLIFIIVPCLQGVITWGISAKGTWDLCNVFCKSATISEWKDKQTNKLGFLLTAYHCVPWGKSLHLSEPQFSLLLSAGIKRDWA